jgi:hypothetical protein
MFQLWHRSSCSLCLLHGLKAPTRLVSGSQFGPSEPRHVVFFAPVTIYCVYIIYIYRSWAPNLNCDPRSPATCHQRFTVTWLEEIQWNLQISDPSWKNCFPLAMPGILHEVQHICVICAGRVIPRWFKLKFPVKTREIKTYSPKRGGGAHPMPVSPRGVMPWGYGREFGRKPGACGRKHWRATANVD